MRLNFIKYYHEALSYHEHSSWLTLEHPPEQPHTSSQQVVTWALRAHPLGPPAGSGVQLEGKDAQGMSLAG
eukprot:scaffold31573_cov16-Tisochrysis_lutea.AAC.1